ncbi:hypothetical protein I6B53_04920 [Schaalia sp. 19OD2882]|uniref:hypothetical protein n=1 Tax=Schaalia sp. 19OD2882 TaxID=2794089 RepID=UPI001C1EF3BA|nr:hypothetical protein [Schaalia sp. 19OD2882]QWW20420.1 hypothetical protein I6B53_04920 [Schaalia sp. 19OD2882]
MVESRATGPTDGPERPGGTCGSGREHVGPIVQGVRAIGLVFVLVVARILVALGIHTL